jgi:hypothetical protein
VVTAVSVLTFFLNKVIWFRLSSIDYSCISKPSSEALNNWSNRKREDTFLHWDTLSTFYFINFSYSSLAFICLFCARWKCLHDVMPNLKCHTLVWSLNKVIWFRLSSIDYTCISKPSSEALNNWSNRKREDTFLHWDTLTK